MSAQILVSAGIVGCSVIAGVFFTFSGFVMPALGRLPAPQGIAAMQAINVTAVTPPLMIALFGTAAVCLTIAVDAVRSWGTPGAALRLLAALLYLIGAVGVTIACNVPRNNTLAALDPRAAQAASSWATYLRECTVWNTVRAAAALLAAATLLAGG